MRQAFALLLTRSLLSLVGAVLTTVSALVFLTLFVLEFMGMEGGPYVGIIAFVIIPSVFVFGLVLIPIGNYLVRRRDQKRAAAGQPQLGAPVLDFNQPHTRRMAALVVVLTTVNLIIIATATYKGVEVMDSTEFCGGACHSVMSPEFTTYQRSPHARVNCTECHIGPGASWFVKSKLSGAWQLVSVAFDLYPKPIPTPVHNLRPARETCEQCHWPSKFVGDRLKIISTFEEDEAQTEKKTVLLLNIGGIRQGKGHGIHWHVDPGNEIRYRSDEKRQVIAEVELKTADGKTTLFKPTEPKEGVKIEEGWRTMDCIDCHNRPTHIYKLPEPEIDAALAAGTLDKSIPFIKREGLRIIQADYPSTEAAQEGIKKSVLEFYEANYAELAKSEPDKLTQAAAALFDIYKVNVFPQMNIKWGTYPSFLGHDGCWRCHDKKHEAEGGKAIAKRCDQCHQALAEEEEEPEIMEILYP